MLAASNNPDSLVERKLFNVFPLARLSLSSSALVREIFGRRQPALYRLESSRVHRVSALVSAVQTTQSFTYLVQDGTVEASGAYNRTISDERRSLILEVTDEGIIP